MPRFLSLTPHSGPRSRATSAPAPAVVSLHHPHTAAPVHRGPVFSRPPLTEVNFAEVKAFPISIQSLPALASRFVQNAFCVTVPNLEDFIAHLCNRTKVNPYAVLGALILLQRVKIRCPTDNLTQGVAGTGSAQRLFTAAMMIANKANLDDNQYTNKSWARAATDAGSPGESYLLETINACEAELFQLLDWDILMTTRAMNSFAVMLERDFRKPYGPYRVYTTQDFKCPDIVSRVLVAPSQSQSHKGVPITEEERGRATALVARFMASLSFNNRSA